MSSRGRARVRGRPPKSGSAGRGSASKKPRYLYAGGHTNSVSYRQRLREGLRQDSFVDESESDSEASDNEVDEMSDYRNHEDSENGADSHQAMEVDYWNPSDVERDTDDDYNEGADRSDRVHEERRKVSRRATTPVFLQEREKPLLDLPPSSEDLVLSKEFLMRALNVYEAMRHFGNILRMTPFSFEDFCGALDSPDHSSLLGECHICLLKAVLREADAMNTHFGPQDIKDSINIHFFLVDHITWPAALQMYLQADVEHRSALLSFLGLPKDHVSTGEEIAYQSEYPLSVGVERRLDILEFLVDQMLSTTPVRDDTTREGAPQHDDHCRVCHKLGDLLCCEQCPAVYHLACLDPPLLEVPSDDWICPVCRAKAVSGVTDCISELERAGLLPRHDILGLDREGRRYWFLVRRIIAESDDGDVRYYSSPRQLDELLSCFDASDFESELVKAINEQRLEIERQMNLTMSLTKTANKTGRRSWLEENQTDVEARLKVKQEMMMDQVTGSLNSMDPPEMLTRSKTATSTNTAFKMGSDGSFKHYTRIYSTNTLALNRHQHGEERDKKRHISHKFSLTPASEFKWIYSNGQSSSAMDLAALLGTIRHTMVHFESQLSNCLLHPHWSSSFRSQWLLAITRCTKTKDFVTALQVLESVMKPCVFVSAWTEALGHTFMKRTTQTERDEKKKQDKKERRGIAGFMALYSGVTEDGMDVSDRSLWCKYTLGLRHQVWKQKGEEFRIVGTGGWCWNSRTRIQRHKPMSECGLRSGPDKLLVQETASGKVKVFEFEELAQTQRYIGLAKTMSKKEIVDTLSAEHDVKIPDVLDISEALVQETRMFYPRIAATGKLDDLLDRRTKLHSKMQAAGGQTEDASKILPPGLACYACRGNRASCYSPLCRMYVKSLEASMKLSDTKQKFDLGDRSNEVRKPRKKQLPLLQKFTTLEGKRKSVLVLEKHDYRKLARRTGLGEAQGFSYSAKSNSQVWNYGSAPRPVIRTMWRWRNTQSLYMSGSWTALQLRILWHSLKWDDLIVRPPLGGVTTVTNESHVETTELIRRRDLAPYGLRSEYLVRKLTVPIEVPTKSREKSTPQRSGLRERRRAESPQTKGPQVTEIWVPEEQLEIWELKAFQDKLEKQIKDRAQEKITVTPTMGDKVHLVQMIPKTTLVTSSPQLVQSANLVKVVGTGKSAAEIRAQMEANLRAQRLALQGKKIVTVSPAQGTPVSAIVNNQGGAIFQTTVGGVGVRRIITQTAQGQNGIQVTSNSPRQIIIRPNMVSTNPGTPTATIIRSGIRPAISTTPGQTVVLDKTPQQIRPLVRRVHIVQGADGTVSVRGLQPGQQLLKHPDGRFQIINVQPKNPQVLAPAAPVTPGTPGMSKIVIQTSTPGQVGGQKLIQLRPAGPVTPQNVSNTVKAVKLFQTTTPTGQIITTAPQGGTIIQAGSTATPIQVVQPGGTPQTVMLNTNAVVQSLAGQPQKVLINAAGGGHIIMTKPAPTISEADIKTEPMKSLQTANIANVGASQKIIIATQPANASKIVASPVAGKPVATVVKTSGQPITQAAGSSGATIVLAHGITQQIVKQALLNPASSPEFQQKLLTLQKQQGTNNVGAKTILRTTNIAPAVKVKEEPTLVATNVMKKENVSSDDALRESGRAGATSTLITQTCHQVLRNMITQVEREERNQLRKQKTKESELEKKHKAQQVLLTRQTDALKKSIMKKRAYMERELAAQIETELEVDKNAMENKQKVQVTSTINGSPPKPPAAMSPVKAPNKNVRARKRPQAVPNTPIDSAPKKKLKTGPGNAPGGSASKVYCVCKKPYDPKRFTIACDVCSNWFHPGCVGLTEDEARQSPSYVCKDCDQQPAEDEEELYCICKTAYDDSQFYIFCDSCQGWFHGRCVGVLQSEANNIDVYTCPECRMRTGSEENPVTLLNVVLTKGEQEALKKLLMSVKSHKQAWPFKEPVNKRQAPDYYQIIKNPMDLRRMEQKLNASKYQTLSPFVADMTKIFENCRYYNPKETAFYQCAELLEAFFVQRMKLFKETLQRRLDLQT